MKPRFEVLGDQCGTAEDELKQILSSRFSALGCILRAYLVRVERKGFPDVDVALCLRVKSKTSESEVVASVSSIFASLFNSSEHLDLIFVSNEEETQFATRCAPFYVRH